MSAPAAPATDWFHNDKLFLAELATGHRYAVLVADRLRERGLHVVETPMEVRDGIADRVRFTDEHDLTVGLKRPCRIDVKSRELRFTRPGDYPYETALVDTVAGWEAKENHPKAIVLVSQITEAMLVISPRTQARWEKVRRFDRKRRITDTFYEVSYGHLRTFDELVEYLHARER